MSNTDQAGTKQSGLTIASLVLGIISLVFCWVPIFNNFIFFTGLLGGTFGLIVLIGKKPSNKTLTIVALALNVIAILLVLGTQSMYSAAITAALS